MLTQEEMTEFLTLFEKTYHVRKDSVIVLDSTAEHITLLSRLLDQRLLVTQFTRGTDTVIAFSLNAEEKLRDWICHATSD